MIQRLRSAGVTDYLAKALTGHAHEAIHDSVYGDQASPKELLAALEKVVLPL